MTKTCSCGGTITTVSENIRSSIPSFTRIIDIVVDTCEHCGLVDMRARVKRIVRLAPVTKDETDKTKALEPKSIKVGEAARRLNVSRKHIYDLIHNKRLGCVDVSGGRAKTRASVRIPIEEIDRFIRDNTYRGTRASRFATP